MGTQLKKLLLGAALGLGLASCGFIIGLDKKYNATSLDVDKTHFSLVFSHSISGETHPCGCRHHPLGGLPQVAGMVHDLQKTKDIFYVDTGDMLFPANIVPKHIEKSLAFTAVKLAKGLDKIGLKYMVPGDQDLALGWDFLKSILKEVKFELLISNLTNKDLIAHKKYVKINFGKQKIFLVGLVDPETMNGQNKSYFIPPIKAFPTILKELEAQGYKKGDPNSKLVVLSHAGMDADEILAKKYPGINWIIGAHSQSFTNYPNEVGKTKIVQVLSKNHYLGEVMFPAEKQKIEEPFKYHEMREQVSEKLAKNPWHKYIADLKVEVEKIRDQEQKAFTTFSSETQKLSTAKSCLECHQDQTDHWAETPHAVSFASLLTANEANNTTCIKCHSLGLGDKAGFVNFNDMVAFKLDDKTKFKAHQEKYWAEVKQAFAGVDSVRKQSKKSLKKLSKTWMKIDEKYQVEHNFANVQCLNCHSQHPDHPFSVGEGDVTKQTKFTNMKNKCLSCHTPEQSPEWYGKDKRGIQSRIDDDKIRGMMKKISCPKAK
jgi:hypothetical protein